MARCSTAPLVATPSNAHALCPTPRNLTDRQLHMIRERGGMVGFNFATFYLNADGRADPSTGRDVLLRHFDHLTTEARERHVWQPIPEEVRARFQTPLPRDPQPFGDVYEDLRTNMIPYAMGNIHPRFWGWYMGSGSFTAALGDFSLPSTAPTSAEAPRRQP